MDDRLLIAVDTPGQVNSKSAIFQFLFGRLNKTFAVIHWKHRRTYLFGAWDLYVAIYRENDRIPRISRDPISAGKFCMLALELSCPVSKHLSNAWHRRVGDWLNSFRHSCRQILYQSNGLWCLDWVRRERLGPYFGICFDNAFWVPQFHRKCHCRNHEYSSQLPWFISFKLEGWKAH